MLRVFSSYFASIRNISRITVKAEEAYHVKFEEYLKIDVYDWIIIQALLYYLPPYIHTLDEVMIGALPRCAPSKQQAQRTTLTFVTVGLVHIQRSYNIWFLGQGSFKNQGIKNNEITKVATYVTEENWPIMNEGNHVTIVFAPKKLPTGWAKCDRLSLCRHHTVLSSVKDKFHGSETFKN